MRYILALDSTMTGCSAAFIDMKSAKFVVRRNDAPRGQAEFLVPLAQECVRQAGANFDDLDLIVTMHGPGSFTGLRVSLSAAKSFALALDVPLAGLTSTEVLVRQYLENMCGEGADENIDVQDICVLIETKRSDFYYQVFDRTGAAKSKVQAAEAEEILGQLLPEKTMLIGDAIARFVCAAGGPRFAGEYNIVRPDPVIMAKMGRNMLQYGEIAESIEPLYLRGADVSMPKVSPRKIRG